MAIASGQVSIPSTVGGTAIVPSRASTNYVGGNSDEPPTRYVLVNNGSGAIIYLGASGVTSTTGLPVAVSTTVGVWLHADEALYGITASSTSTVSYLESGS